MCTDEGCARFTAAAIKEAEEGLDNYIEDLSADKKEIMDDLNKDEKDALLVTTNKRGPEEQQKRLDRQLDIMLEKRIKQKYIQRVLINRVISSCRLTICPANLIIAGTDL